MIKQQVEDCVKKIISRLFEIDLNEITPLSSPETIQSWDSIGQMNLIVSLEEEFNVTFSDSQVLEMRSFQLVCMTVCDALDLTFQDA